MVEAPNLAKVPSLGNELRIMDDKCYQFSFKIYHYSSFPMQHLGFLCSPGTHSHSLGQSSVSLGYPYIRSHIATLSMHLLEL